MIAFAAAIIMLMLPLLFEIRKECLAVIGLLDSGTSLDIFGLHR